MCDVTTPGTRLLPCHVWCCSFKKELKKRKIPLDDYTLSGQDTERTTLRYIRCWLSGGTCYSTWALVYTLCVW